MYFRDLVKNRILITGANGMLGQRVVDFYSHKYLEDANKNPQLPPPKFLRG